jgi:hypothetical protein
MKIQRTYFVKSDENGMATVIFIALLAIMMILVVANGRALFQLRRETQLLEQKQIKRLAGSQTNVVAGVSLPENNESR